MCNFYIVQIIHNYIYIETKTHNYNKRNQSVTVNIVKKEGFLDFEEQKVIKIGPPYDRTLPDLYYEDEDIRVGVYLDGLSNAMNGNDKQIVMDNMIRNQLEDMEIEVVSIAVSDLDDPEALNKCLRKIARKDLQKKYK